MRRWVPLICFVALVALAGCGGVFGSDTTATSRAPSNPTPAPVPTDGPLSDPPPGLSEDGITDTAALAGAHADALANTSFTIRTDRTLTAANGTQLAKVSNVQYVGANHRRWMVERGFNTTIQHPVYQTAVRNLDVWANGTRGVIRLQGPNGTTYRPRPEAERSDPTRRGQLRSYYLADEAVRVSTANGRIQLRAALTPQNTRGLTMPPVNVTERTITLTLTETGRVERYRIEYTGRLVNESETVVEGVNVVRFTALGETGLEQPGWVATARNATTPIGGPAG